MKQPLFNFNEGENNRMMALLKTLLVVGGTAVSFLLGAWHISLTILLVFMVMDIITGLIKGAVNKELRSATGWKGMLRKGAIMFVVIIAHFLDVLVGGGMPVFRTMATYFYVGNEGISILENLGQIGVPIPKFISKYLEQLKKQNDDDSNKGNK